MYNHTIFAYRNGLSIRDTGSIGILLLLIVICLVVYKTVSYLGSKLASAIITAAVILTFISLNQSPHIDVANLYALIFMLIPLGFIILAVKCGSHETYTRKPGLGHAPLQQELPDDIITRIHRDRNLNFNLDKYLRKLKNEAQLLQRDPAQASQFYQYISRMLPAEGYLTERMAKLREKAHKIRSGHIARIRETKSLTKLLPQERLAQVSTKLIAGYYSELDFERRLERLDNEVAINEKKIIELLKKAQHCSKQYKFRQIPDLFKHAEQIQHQNEKLFKIIEHTENKLSELANKITRQQMEEYKNAKIKRDNKPSGN